MSPARPLFTGAHTARLSRNRRLTLPASYELARVNAWFLFPAPSLHSEHLLQLHPGTTKVMQAAIRLATGTEIAEPTTEDTLAALHILTIRDGLPTDAISALAPSPRSNHLQLSVPQVAWLKARSGHLKINGVLAFVMLRSCEAWERMQRRHRYERLDAGPAQ